MNRQEFGVVCTGCGKRYTFDIDPEDYYRFQHGTYAQVAFPYLTADQRELMVSRICGPCFDKMFPPDDEETSPSSDRDEFTDEEWDQMVTSLEQMLRGDPRPAKTREEEENDDSV